MVTYSNKILTGSMMIDRSVIRNTRFSASQAESAERIIYLGHGVPNAWKPCSKCTVRVQEIPKREIVSIACGTLFPKHDSIYFADTLIGVHWLSDMYPFIRKLLELSLNPDKSLDEIYREIKIYLENTYSQNPSDTAILRAKRVIKRGLF